MERKITNQVLNLRNRKLQIKIFQDSLNYPPSEDIYNKDTRVTSIPDISKRKS
jgi:hypothetical protein